MPQRDQYQETIDWLKKDEDKLEAAIEYRSKQLFDTTHGMSHEENPEVVKPNPYNEHVMNEVYLKRYQLENEGFFTTIAEGDAWEAKK